MSKTENANITTMNEPPLSPEVERVRRKLMRLMLVAITITFLFLACVLIAVIYKITRNPSSADLSSSSLPSPSSLPTTPIEQQLALPSDAHIIAHSLADPIIALETSDPQGNRIFILYDYRAARLVTRLKITISNAPIPNGEE